MTVQLPSLTEGEYSQTLAALDERAKRLTRVLEDARTEPVTVDRERAIEWNLDALHHTNMARLRLSEADDASSWTAA